MSLLVAIASAAAPRTMALVCVSRRLILLIEAESSSTAAAAVSTSADALFDPPTAPSALCNVWSDVVSKLLAAIFIDAALFPTVERTLSTPDRNKLSPLRWLRADLRVDAANRVPSPLRAVA